MMLIDSHTHLYLPQFSEDIHEVISRAEAAKVHRFCLPNIDVASIPLMKALVAKYPGKMFPMMGLHPGSVDDNWKQQLAIIEKELYSEGYIAVGEIGLDYYWSREFVKEQKEVFSKQIEWAAELKLPIVIHNRDAFSDALSLTREAAKKGVTGIFHCFTGTVQEAEQIKNIGFLMGIGGVLTYKKAGLDEVLAKLELEDLVIETDSPYLTPVPFRGKRNESAYCRLIAEKLAEIYGRDFEDVATVTSSNTSKIFKLPLMEIGL